MSDDAWSLPSADPHAARETITAFEILRLKDFAELSADWFWEQDAEFRFTRFFGLSTEKLRRNQSDFLGKRRWDMHISGITPEQLAQHIAAYERHVPFRDFEYEVPGDGGAVQVYSISGTPVFNARAEFVGYHGVGRNITELRMAERAQRQHWQELQLAHAELQRAMVQLVQSEKLAALGSLVCGVAHELNTPIGSGLTAASTLAYKAHEFSQAVASGLKRSTLDTFVHDTQALADALVRSLQRSAELVSRFKQLAVDQTSAQRRPFALSDVVAEIVLTLGPSLRDSGCTLTTQIQPDLQLDSYPGPLGQVLSHLISNAMLHGYGDAPGGPIAIHAIPHGLAEIALEVRDQGRGVAPAHLQRIFEPFFTTRLGQGGSGLGLYVVHNIVTGVLGGQISVHSATDQGSSFRLVLPLRAPG